MEQKVIVLRERTRRTRHRSRKDVRARRRICGVLAALCFLLLLGVGGGRIPVCSKAIDTDAPEDGGEESASCSCW